jgi:pseudaminic acid synthase
MNFERPLFVAEISANHLGSFSRAKELVHAAIEAGAGAVKLQTYTAATMTLDISTEAFRISAEHELWGGRKLYELYEEAHTPWEWHSELFQICRNAGVIPFSSPFDSSAIDFLESLNAPMYKIASMESGDIPLITKAALTGKPIIISTGGTSISEVGEAVDACKLAGNNQITLLVCTSSYPAAPEDANLLRIKKLQQDFNVDVGVSDHSLGIGVSLAAISLGAKVIEKHFTLKRSDGGADGQFSMEPEEFADLVKEGTDAFAALGTGNWDKIKAEDESRRLRRSLYIVRDVNLGEKVTEENVRAIRPNGGESPKHLPNILGKTFNKPLPIGSPLKLEYLD